uniref:Secreted protein n=1 Tax=Pipistrellus kuhlii TaxID=59472 RepID=A0A7J7SFW3_PIPKU|nr:hypothetical protein mPipKuh1_009971 [Pipistrellus kuhlii]
MYHIELLLSLCLTLSSSFNHVLHLDPLQICPTVPLLYSYVTWSSSPTQILHGFPLSMCHAEASLMCPAKFLLYPCVTWSPAPTYVSHGAPPHLCSLSPFHTQFSFGPLLVPGLQPRARLCECGVGE